MTGSENNAIMTRNWFMTDELLNHFEHKDTRNKPNDITIQSMGTETQISNDNAKSKHNNTRIPTQNMNVKPSNSTRRITRSMTKKRNMDDARIDDVIHTIDTPNDRKKILKTIDCNPFKLKRKGLNTSTTKDISIVTHQIENTTSTTLSSKIDASQTNRSETNKTDIHRTIMNKKTTKIIDKHMIPDVKYDDKKCLNIESDITRMDEQITLITTPRNVALIDLKNRTSENFAFALKEAKNVCITISKFPTDIYDEIMNSDSLRGKQLSSKLHKRVYVTSKYIFKGPYDKQHVTLKNVAFRSIICNAMNLHIAYPSGFFRDPKGNIFVSYINVASEVNESSSYTIHHLSYQSLVKNGPVIDYSK